MKSLTSAYKLILLTLFLSGCFHSVSEYDVAAYRNLTDLKNNMAASFNKYINSGAKGENDLDAFKKYKEDISTNYNDARTKEKNQDVIAQWKILDSQMNEMMDTFQKNDSLSSGYCLEKWKTMEEAFNTAIEEKK